MDFSMEAINHYFRFQSTRQKEDPNGEKDRNGLN